MADAGSEAAGLEDEVRAALEVLAPGAAEEGGAALTSALDRLRVAALCSLAMDAVQTANSGHPGGPCSSMDFAYVLHARHLRMSRDLSWRDRDRFVLSGGHMSTLLYGMLVLQGRISLDDLKKFRQLGSCTQGHPVNSLCPGVETTTGPLGQGFANGVGMALAERLARETFGEDLVDHRTWVLATDGDLQEGVCREAAQLAGHWALGHLNVFWDANEIQLASPTASCWTEDVPAFFKGCGWHVQIVEDGHDHAALDAAIEAAVAETGRPSMIVGKTKIAKGTDKEGLVVTHGSPLGDETISAYKAKHGIPDRRFWFPEALSTAYHPNLDEGDHKQDAWKARLEARLGEDKALAERWDLFYGPERQQALRSRAAEAIRALSFDGKLATRASAGKALAALAEALPSMVGGSADLANSTKTDGFEKAVGYLGEASSEDGPAPRGLHYGVREHAMASITNGLALHGGWLPFCGTFLAFSDYMRPTIRLAAISKLGVSHVFTHDSIFLGEDGETHQPVEQTESLRLIPGYTVIRPGDAYEAAEAWVLAVEIMTSDHPQPVALILSRQGVPTLDGGFERARGLHQGGYVISGGDEVPEVELVASGSEVSLALEAAEVLRAGGRRVRVVSMPCREIFERQPAGVRDGVLHPDCRARLVLEAGTVRGWEAVTGDALVDSVRVEGYGESAPAAQLAETRGFTAQAVADKAQALVERSREDLEARIAADLRYLEATAPEAAKALRERL